MGGWYEMTMPLTDKNLIKYFLQGFDEDALKEALRDLYPNWDL